MGVCVWVFTEYQILLRELVVKAAQTTKHSGFRTDLKHVLVISEQRTRLKGVQERGLRHYVTCSALMGIVIIRTS